MEWILHVSSITNAMRGKSVLERNGFTAYVQRAVDAQGNNGSARTATATRRNSFSKTPVYASEDGERAG